MIAASNRDLRAEIAGGRFRGDLFYRLNVVELKLPPLRERREDIPYLTAAFVKETSERLQKSVAGLTSGAERLLAAGYWDGNVRELRNVIERACILVEGEFITERELAVSMTLVGAPLAYVRGPFVVEGVLQGGAGALLAMVLLWVVFAAAKAKYGVAAAEAVGLGAITFLPVWLSLFLVLGGMVLGCLGGLIVARAVR